MEEQNARSLDWQAWHTDYDHSDTPLSRRLALVQAQIGRFLDEFTGTPVRVVSFCSGEARDLLGVLATHPRRDIVGRLVELDPVLADRARVRALGLGLSGALEFVAGDAGVARSYAGAVPADLVLVCGVFGNISDADVERTVRALPEFCAPGATMVWTRHRREPDLTVSIRRWLAESGFEELAFETLPDGPQTVGAARFVGQTQPLTDQQLFVFNRESL